MSQQVSVESCTDLTNMLGDGFVHYTAEPHKLVPSDTADLFLARRESVQENPIVAPPRPPRHSKSMGHLPKLLDNEKPVKRRRSASTCKSTHSLFECSEGCFSNDDITPSAQFVTITTGPMVL